MVFKRFDRRIIERIAADDDGLEKVKLNGKRVDDAKLAELSKVLSSNTSITSLHLSNNTIGHKGIAALVDALHQNLHVEYIDLSGNTIGSKGAAALAACLKYHNTSVISLNLQDNGIGDEGAEALLSAVLTNSTVHSLNLRGNAIHSSLLAKIDEALNRSKALFETEVVYFAPSPAKEDDHDLAVVDTFSMTLSEESSGDDHSFDSSTDDICVETTNNYIFQGAPNAESSSPSQLNAEGMAVNWMTTIGSFFHNDETYTNVDGNVLKVIPVSDDEGYYEFLAFLKSERDQDQRVAEEPSLPLPQSEKVLGAQQLSDDKDEASSSHQENPIGATFNWIGSLFHNEKDENVKSGENERVPRIIPVSDDEGYEEFIAFLKT